MNEFSIGSIVPFGSYHFRVLDIQNGAALLLTEEIIEQRGYHDAYKHTTWAGCALRRYLNGAFYEAFNEADRSKIVLVTNKNSDNPWYGAAGGEDTQDHVFLLSVEEAACKYFGDSSANLYHRGENQRYWLQRRDENNCRRRAKAQGCIWWWWLRTPGRDHRKAMYIHGDGNIGIQGNNIFRRSSTACSHPINGENQGGVRPALWMRL